MKVDALFTEHFQKRIQEEAEAFIASGGLESLDKIARFGLRQQDMLSNVSMAIKRLSVDKDFNPDVFFAEVNGSLSTLMNSAKESFPEGATLINKIIKRFSAKRPEMSTREMRERLDKLTETLLRAENRLMISQRLFPGKDIKDAYVAISSSVLAVEQKIRTMGEAPNVAPLNNGLPDIHNLTKNDMLKELHRRKEELTLSRQVMLTIATSAHMIEDNINLVLEKVQIVLNDFVPLWDEILSFASDVEKTAENLEKFNATMRRAAEVLQMNSSDVRKASEDIRRDLSDAEPETEMSGP